MDSPRSRRARVAPPADGLVLYSRARSSWKSVHERVERTASQPRAAGCPERGQKIRRVHWKSRGTSESNELPASREQRDVRKTGGGPCGSTMADTGVKSREPPGTPSTIRIPHTKGTVPTVRKTGP